MAEAPEEKPAPKPVKLSLKEQAFIASFISSGWNATRAARAMGYQGKNPDTYGYCMLHKPHVKAAIEEELKIRQLSANQVLTRLAEMANLNITQFLDDKGKVDWEKVQEKGYLVKGRRIRTRTDKDGNTYEECELELYDAQSALEKLGKFHKLFSDQLKLEGDLKFEFVINGEKEIG